MTEAGWMLVVLVCAVLAYRRVGRDSAHEERVKKLEASFSEWPAPAELLERLDDLEAELKELADSGTTMSSVVERANVLTKDVLAVKTLVAEHREQLTQLRTARAMRALGGSVDP